jgi:putative hydroxymethylpyrimidine transport system substrate-binding protein
MRGRERGKMLCLQAIAVLAAAFLVGCGGSGDAAPQGGSPEGTQARSDAPPELKLSADGWLRAEAAGLATAEAQGYFEDGGLDVWLGVPHHPSRTIPYVLGGTVDLGIAQLPQAVIARSAGAPIVVLGSIIPEPTDALISLRSAKIDSVADLEGKTVAIPGLQYQERLLESALERKGLTLKDVALERVGHDVVPALLEGSADAIFGGLANLEGEELRVRGAKPVIVGARSLGIPDYDQLVLVTRARLVEEKPEAIEAFMSAVAKGTALAQRDPKAAFEAVELTAEGDYSATPAITRSQLEATLPLLSPGAPMDLDRAQSLIDWMEQEGMLAKAFSADTLLPEGSGL